MEKKTLTLHIGQSKTGTSSIQKFCRIHKKELADQGVLYPSATKNGVDVRLLEHNAFAETLCGVNRYPYLPYEDYIRQFDGEFALSPCRTMLLSAESFWGMPHIWELDDEKDFPEANKRKLAKLREWTQNYRLEIILYLRHPLSWFRSALSHIIRYEGLLAKRIYESDEQLYELLKPHLNYVQLIRMWQDILKPDAFHIQIFDKALLYQNSSISDFCRKLGIQGSGEESLEENTSWPAEVTILKRELNATPKSKWKERTIIEILSSYCEESSNGKVYEIDPALQRRIIEDFEPQRETLSVQYGLDFKTPEIRTAPPIDPEKIENVKLFYCARARMPSTWLMASIQATKAAARDNLTLPYNLLKSVVKRRSNA